MSPRFLLAALLLIALRPAAAQSPIAPINIEQSVREALEAGRARGENLVDLNAADAPPPAAQQEPTPPAPAATVAQPPPAAPQPATAKPSATTAPVTAPAPAREADRPPAPPAVRPATTVYAPPAEAAEPRLNLNNRTLIIRGAQDMGELRGELEEAQRRKSQP